MEIFNIILIQPLTNGLILFYKILFENLGLAIVGFSVFLRFLLNPLTKPYMQSMKKMKEIEPLVAKLKKKYEGDKTGLMKAQSDLYKQKGVNPGAGCLPYILQIVVLIALFNVFTRVLGANATGVIEINKLLYAPIKLSQDSHLNTGFLYLDITKPDVFRIPSVPFPIPGPVLILAALIQMISAKMMMPAVAIEEKIAKKTKGAADDMQVAMQQSSLYTFPLFTIIFGLNFPSGLALYWLVFSLFQAWQQYNTSGWGGVAPWIKKLGLLQSETQK